jgi:solute carrier family 13 (sodium-dependent dicarboxylate transporter), member 2/3/5
MSNTPDSQAPQALLSPAEERFEEVRRLAGRYGAPVVLAAVWFAPIPGLAETPRHLFAIVCMALVLWVTEAVPLAATALLAPSLCVVAGLGSAREVFKPFADPVIFLFMGSFMLGEAMLKHGLNRRFAFGILGLPWVGTNPLRLYAAFGGITALISMWVSNAATTAMMLPIGLSIIAEIGARQGLRDFRSSPFAAGLMLITAFAASVGGLGTPIGTPPNLIGIGAIERLLGVKVTFFQWMKIGLPTAIILTVFLVWRFARSCPPPAGALEGNQEWLHAEGMRLGPWTRGQKNVVAVFAAAVLAWVVPGFVAAFAAGGASSGAYTWLSGHLPESIVGMLAASALFILPAGDGEGSATLEWKDATGIDWGTILLFAGGMALGELMFSTGLARWIGAGLAGVFHAKTVFGLTLLFTVVGVLVSEMTTNTASATMIVPIAIAVAQASGVDPLKPALAACIACSMGFLLPVSTGPNAMAYGTGCVPLKAMMRHGIWLDVVGTAVIVTVVTFLA